MLNYVITVNYELCDKCLKCVFLCALTKHGTLCPEYSAIRVDNKEGIYSINICHQCDPAPCVSICSFNALYRDKKTGAILVNKSKCTACKQCIGVCPYNAIIELPSGVIFKCDLCNGDPLCVKACPTNAIKYLKPSPTEIKTTKEFVSVILRIKSLKA